MPLGVTLILAVVALVLLRKGRLRTAGVFLLASILYLYTMATPFVGEWLYARLESNYPPVPVERIPAAGCMIVLGGVVQAPAPPRIDIEFNDAVDRVHKAAELFHAGKAPYVIVTGGNQPWSTTQAAEADLIRDLLVKWGVPEEAIMLEGSSRNTRENAMFTRNIVDAIHCEEALLVTSAAHMPRAVAAFRSVGISVSPVSTDVRVADTERMTVMDFLPDARALRLSSDAIRELVGQWVYELRGWN
jgi:uncharacterized SAM-binding protein YcdF (DUF218 family)